MGMLCHRCPAQMHDTLQAHSLGASVRDKNISYCHHMTERSTSPIKIHTLLALQKLI